jgi:hypothetical protein
MHMMPCTQANTEDLDMLELDEGKVNRRIFKEIQDHANVPVCVGRVFEWCNK